LGQAIEYRDLGAASLPASRHVPAHFAGANQPDIHPVTSFNAVTSCGVVIKTYMLSRMNVSRTRQRDAATAAAAEKRISVLFVCMGITSFSF
jgi:hypothetical protein